MFELAQERDYSVDTEKQLLLILKNKNTKGQKNYSSNHVLFIACKKNVYG